MMVSVLASCGLNKNAQILGLKSDRIVNGEAVPEDSIYLQTTVAIYITSDEKDHSLKQVCTGTLIAPNVVLTAAHCADDQVSEEATDYRIVFGSAVVESDKDLNKVTIRKGKEITLHSEWKNENITNPRDPSFDLALISFEGEMPEGFKTAKLPSPEFKLDYKGKMVAVGYGLTQGVPDIGATELRRVDIKMNDWSYSITHFETRMHEGGTCDGDSGGPAYLKESNPDQLTIIGITSFGDKYCKSTGYFVRVPTFTRWIQKELKLLK